MSKKWLIDSVGTVTVAELENIDTLTEDDLLLAARANKTNKITFSQLRNNVLSEDSVNGQAIADRAIANNHLGDRIIVADNIVDHTITTTQLASTANSSGPAVGTDNIQNEAITTDKIADGAIKADNIASNAITVDKLNNDAVTTEKVADEAITADKIAPNTITVNNISTDLFQAINNNNTSFTLNDDQKSVRISYFRNIEGSNNLITTNDIADRAVTTNKLASLQNGGFAAVGTDNIQNGAITTDKLNFTTLPSPIDSIVTNQLQDSAVTREKIADNAINTNKVDMNNFQLPNSYNLVDSIIITTKIANEAVTTEKIATGAITTNQLASTSSISGAAVDTDNIKDNVITTNKIVNSAILEDKIASGAVTTNKIADGAITFDKTNFSSSSVDYSNLQYGDASAELVLIRFGKMRILNFWIGDGTAFGNNITGVDTIYTLNETDRPKNSTIATLLARSQGGWAGADYDVVAGYINTNGEINISGNKTVLSTKQYITGQAIYFVN